MLNNRQLLNKGPCHSTTYYLPKLPDVVQKTSVQDQSGQLAQVCLSNLNLVLQIIVLHLHARKTLIYRCCCCVLQKSCGSAALHGTMLVTQEPFVFDICISNKVQITILSRFVTLLSAPTIFIFIPV